MKSTAKIYMTRSEAAQYATERGIPLTKGALNVFATRGGGPVYRRFGRHTLYTADDLDTWIARKMTPALRSTSELAA
jgi:hypothetical protein